MWHFRKSVSPFKIGPDFIDPQFHKIVSGTPSINLDTFIMTKEQVKWLYSHYANRDVSILEGVMGFYDGEDRGCSTYGVSKLLNIPTILILNGAGTYITISAILKGLLEYREDNTIKAVIINNLSSSMHYRLIKDIIEKDYPHIIVLGWIRKNLPTLSSRHLGLDLKDLDKIETISREVLENIDIDRLSLLTHNPPVVKEYPFPRVKKIDKRLAIVNDENFSFLYYDNLSFLQELFRDVIIINSIQDEVIPKNCDIVYICGGYVETREAYKKIKNSKRFKESLIRHAKKKKAIYAECAGLLYLSKRVDDKEMSGILDIEFTLDKRFNRLGYYYSENGTKGHAFHYTKPTKATIKKGFDILSKRKNQKGEVGSWRDVRVFGTYLHTMFRCNSSSYSPIF